LQFATILEKEHLMLYTLFSPAENKKPSGSCAALSTLLFSLETRRGLLDTYESILTENDGNELKKLFGLKKESDITALKTSLFNSPTLPALERYSGVAYEYLDYASLQSPMQKYLCSHTIIFSNLFGPILGGDLIPNYKVKQGESIRGIAPDQYYKKATSLELDALLHDADILDLRAGYYHKFYTPKQPYHTVKFLKEGKVVSHWAKAYRGILLRKLAQHHVESVGDFVKLDIENLRIKDILHVKNKTEIVYEIVQ
jgi:hypothetical protein